MIRKVNSGFTLVELTIVLTLIVVVMGLVIVRFDLGSQRQRVISEARKLGRLISSYREKAIDEQQMYALTIDLNGNRYTIVQPVDSSLQAVHQSQPLVDNAVVQPIRFATISVQNKALASPVTVFFDPRGVMPEVAIELGIDQGPTEIIRTDALANEVYYDDR